MKKLILSLVLIFFITLSSKRIYSYSQEINTKAIDNDNTHIVVSSDVSFGDGKKLIPRGAILGIDDTKEITYTYTLFVQDNIEIDYFVNSMEIDGEEIAPELSNLFDFEFKMEKVEYTSIHVGLFDEGHSGFYVEVSLVLSMDFPTEEQYDQISGKQLSFQVTFESIESRVSNIE